MAATARTAKAIILDVEGTVCPISFVKDTLFPYALDYVHSTIGPLKTLPSPESDLGKYLEEFPEEHKSTPKALVAHIDDLVARDVKAPYLKALQGYIWKEGYESGKVRAPVYQDAIDFISGAAAPVYIYSSGSVLAQQLLFRHIDHAGSSLDLTPRLAGYFDTKNAGPKTDPASYRSIAEQIGLAPDTITFFTDNPAEIRAAGEAGWNARAVMRPGNAPLPGDLSPITSFENV
ncbi:enolase-phosphatase E1 [Trichomonascus vanleenenianus]|uniref:putative acireductone synthase UTR4 n=1 Tax=Trichomonascus vanleenenianus TaxID=2268995 RepID=UPI003EC956DE